jgi:hypothetical protein
MHNVYFFNFDKDNISLHNQTLNSGYKHASLLKARTLVYQLHRVVQSPNNFRDETKEFCLYHGPCLRNKICSNETTTQKIVPLLKLNSVATVR